MNQAILFVSRISETELRFVLQRTHGPRPAVVLQDSTVLRPEQREQIHKSLQAFAECLEGFHRDEDKFRELGQVLYLVLLPRTVRDELRKLREPLVIVTDDPTLPWEILHDGEEYLALRLPISRQLLIHQQMANLLQPAAAPPGKFAALVIADSLSDLPGARQEGQALARLFQAHGDSDLVLGDDASWENVHRHLVRKAYAIIHYCGHIEYNAAQRLSTIPFRGGSRLSADEILSTFRGTPVVFLNGCRSDPQRATSPSSRGEGFIRSESFVQAFMIGNERGVAPAVVGSMWLVPDEPREASQELARAFYQALLTGGAVGEAMRASRALAANRQWGPMVWGPYVLYGDPCLCPFAASNPNLAPPRPPSPPSLAATGPAPATPTRDMKRQPAEPVKAADTKETPAGVSSTAQDNAAKEAPAKPLPPPKQNPLHELTEAIPLDDSSRRVLLTALREMARLEQGILTSMHLLLGLCAEDTPALLVALDEADIDTACVCTRTRRRAKKLLPALAEDWGISLNAAQLLAAAVQRAVELGRDTVSSEDLLAGLLLCPESEAVRILASFGMSLPQLRAQLSQPRKPAPPTPSPAPTTEALFGEWQFDEAAHHILRHAVRTVKEAGLDFLGTPHLLAALLQGGGTQAAVLFQRWNYPVAPVCDALLHMAAEGAPRNASAVIALRPRCRQILARAQKLSQAEARGTVGERHLLQAVLEEQTGPTADLLREHGIDPDKLVAELRSVN